MSAGVHLTRLALTDFRSYAAADVTLEPGVTTFTGANGQGKTNLVEAACYVATFASHRVATDAPLIRQGAERAILRAGIHSAGRDSLVEIEINSGRANRVRLNRAPAPRPREVIGVLRCVLFAPEDLAVVKGDPGAAPPLPRRPAGRQQAAVRRGPGRLRAGAAPAQRAAEVGQDPRRRSAERDGGLGRPPHRGRR